MKKNLSRYAHPSHYVDWLLRRFANRFRLYLATTPLIWGDEKNVSIGSNAQLADVLINARSGKVTIGEDAFFGHGVMLLTGKHDMNAKGAARHTAVPDQGYDISIGRGAWIASGVIVIGPCRIGENAVIGAGSIVSGDIPSCALFAGNPAKLVRMLDAQPADPPAIEP